MSAATSGLYPDSFKRAPKRSPPRRKPNRPADGPSTFNRSLNEVSGAPSASRTTPARWSKSVPSTARSATVRATVVTGSPSTRVTSSWAKSRLRYRTSGWVVCRRRWVENSCTDGRRSPSWWTTAADSPDTTTSGWCPTGELPVVNHAARRSCNGPVSAEGSAYTPCRTRRSVPWSVRRERRTLVTPASCAWAAVTRPHWVEPSSSKDSKASTARTCPTS